MPNGCTSKTLASAFALASASAALQMSGQGAGGPWSRVSSGGRTGESALGANRINAHEAVEGVIADAKANANAGANASDLSELKLFPSRLHGKE
jgi:hypothetical protein